MTPSYLKMLCPEFKDQADEVLSFWIEEVITQLASPADWGADYKRAVAYLAAHELKISLEQTDEGTSLIAGEGLVGRVQSVKTLDWSVSMTNQIAADNVGDELMMSTIYGQKFIALRDRQVVDPTYSYQKR